MNEITDITSQKKGDRLNVFIDGNFAFGISYETAVKFSLVKGKILSEEDRAAIDEEEGIGAAYDRGLKYAVKKTVSRKQMKEYLLKNGFSISAADAAVSKLNQYGYACDDEYARAYVATYGTSRGKIKIRADLKAAGIDDDIIDEVITNVDENAIDSVIEKYLRTHKEIDRKKIVNYLLYRGFDYEEIKETLGRYII